MRAAALAAPVLLHLLAGAGAASAQDAVVRVEERQFKAGAGLITFSEVPMGTVNPTYQASGYRGGSDSPTVQFGGHFLGRRIAAPADCPRGAVPTGCLSGMPVAPLRLDPSAPRVATYDCPYFGTPRVRDCVPPGLGGTPVWNGPIAIWFDRDVAAVGLDGIGFNTIGATAITVYDRQGRALGRTANRQMPRDFIGLATADLSPRIAGLEFHLVGAEPAGFGIDNVRFGAPEQIDLPGVRPPAAPAPSPPPTPRRPLILP
jgi:hypothetical protein